VWTDEEKAGPAEHDADCAQSQSDEDEGRPEAGTLPALRHLRLHPRTVEPQLLTTLPP
jgi:hypothetical protein